MPSIFGTAVATVVDTVKSTIAFDGRVVSFLTARRKGAGSQEVPVGEFGDYVSMLRRFANDTSLITRPLSAAEMVERSIRIEEGADGSMTVKFCNRSGRGIKHAEVPLSEFGSFVSFLEAARDELS